ncbi:aspartate--tRNA ligase, cytoplasmic-like, partial [Homalodisca vitripennis]
MGEEDKLEDVEAGADTKSKKALKKAAKDAEKAAKKEARKSAGQGEGDKEETDVSEGKYGTFGLIRSSDEDKNRKTSFTHIKDLCPSITNQVVLVRGRLHTSRAKGKQCFMVLRQQQFTVQCLVNVSDTVSKQMVKFASNINKETIIDVIGLVSSVPKEIEACSQKLVEIHVQEIWIVSEAKSQLPLLIEDAARPVKDDDQEGLNIKVNQDTRLDNRILDLRTPANQAIFRLEAGVCRLFRDILTDKGFVEIHTPKIISAASEGGANVFTVSYFKSSAYLAQSPQLY